MQQHLARVGAVAAITGALTLFIATLLHPIVAFAISLLFSRRFPPWLGWLGLVGGLGTIAAGLAQAYTGFSTLAMTLSMPASSVLLLWAIIAGTCMWRLAPRLAGEGSHFKSEV